MFVGPLIHQTAQGMNEMNKRCLALAVAALAALAAPAQAQTGTLSLDLNATEAAENGCRATFVGQNGLDAAIDRLSFEVVLFDGDGLVTRMLALDFGEMATGRTKVLQFTLPGEGCEDIGRVLINDVAACEGPEDASLCLDALTTESRSGITFGL